MYSSNEQMAITIASNYELLQKVANAEIFIDFGKFAICCTIDEIQHELNDMLFGC